MIPIKKLSLTSFHIFPTQQTQSFKKMEMENFEGKIKKDTNNSSESVKIQLMSNHKIISSKAQTCLYERR